MSYVQKVLMDDERVCYQTRPHWIIFVSPIVWFIASLLLFGFGPKLNLNMILFGYPMYMIAAFILFVYTIYLAGSAYIDYTFSEFAVTNRRIIMKRGLVERNSLEILLQKVESVHIGQTILGRIIGYGTIIIRGVGGTQDPFPNIPEPLKFREMVQQQSEKNL